MCVSRPQCWTYPVYKCTCVHDSVCIGYCGCGMHVWCGCVVQMYVHASSCLCVSCTTHSLFLVTRQKSSTNCDLPSMSTNSESWVITISWKFFCTRRSLTMLHETQSNNTWIASFVRPTHYYYYQYCTCTNGSAQKGQWRWPQSIVLVPSSPLYF